MSKSQVKKVIIAGAGPGGLTAALTLRKYGIDCVICEQVDKEHLFADVGGAYDISENVLKAFEDLGVAGTARETASILHSLSTYFWHGRKIGTLVIPKNFDTVGLRRSQLQQLLLKDGDHLLRCATKVVGFDDDGSQVTVHFENGEKEKGDVLIGADGVHSAVRTGLLGKDEAHFCDCMCAWGRFPDTGSLDYKNIPDAGTWLGRGSCIIIAKVSDIFVWSAFWHAKEYKRAPNREASKAKIMKIFSKYDDIVQQAIAVSAPKDIAEVGIWDRDPSPFWTKGRVALIGDAAHPITPFLGQGANGAIIDAYVLGEYLAHKDIETAFAKFQKRRMSGVEKNVAKARKIGNLMVAKSRFSLFLKRLLFGVTPSGLIIRSMRKADKVNNITDIIALHKK